MNFEDFSLGSDILQAIGEIGFEIPTPIQEQLIPILMEDDEDVIGLAQTGTGKTAAFGLPLLLRINPEVKSPQALVVCPTRELCVQVAKDITSFSKYLRSISVTAVYGGAPMDAQIRSIKKGTKIIVATPGRLLDLMNRNVINLSAVNFLALDEADTMLSMGFKDEMDAILEQVPPERRTVLLSATMPREVARIASQFMNNPVEIAAGPKNIGASTVEHGYYMVHARDKYAALKRIVDYHPDMYAIVFCRTRAATQEVADKLLQDEYDAEPLHGDLSQAQRDFVMKKFRDRNLQLLIATDIAARGLDVTDLTHVIHYDLPDDQDTYTHRSGRTGRAGKKGISLAIINMKQKYRIRHLEKVAGARFSEMRVPRGEEICERQLMHLVDRVKSVDIDEDRIASYMPIIEQKLDGLDRDTLIRHFVSLEFNRFIDYYRNLPDLTPPQNQPRQDRDGRRSRESSSGDFTVLKLNIGKKEGIFPADVINLVNRFSGKRITLGKIDIGSSDTRMQVDSFAARTLAESLSGTTVKGRKLRVMVQQSSERKTRYPSGGSKGSSKKGPNQSRSGNYSGKRTAKKRPKKSFYGG